MQPTHCASMHPGYLELEGKLQCFRMGWRLVGRSVQKQSNAGLQVLRRRDRWIE